MQKAKRIIAVLAIISMFASIFAACNSKPDIPEKTSTTAISTQTTGTTTTLPPVTVPVEETKTTATIPSTTTIKSTTTNTTTKPTTKQSTTKTTPKSTTKSTSKKTAQQTTKTTSKATTKNPSNYSKAEIIKTYNSAVNKVINSKAGYSKSRTTNLSKLEGAEAIMKIKVAADAVNGFLGVGTKTYSNIKGEAKYLSKSALTEADIKSAKIEMVNGDIYRISLTLNDGSSTSPTISDSSPLRHCGLYAGKGDKSEYDYKNADNLYVGINGADGASVQSVSENTTNATIVAQVNVKTGKLESVTYKWNWNADLKKVKYSIVTVSGTGKADSSVTIKDIKW